MTIFSKLKKHPEGLSFPAIDNRFSKQQGTFDEREEARGYKILTFVHSLTIDLHRNLSKLILVRWMYFLSLFEKLLLFSFDSQKLIHIV